MSTALQREVSSPVQASPSRLASEELRRDGPAVQGLSPDAALTLGRRQALYDLRTGFPLMVGDLLSVLAAVGIARLTVAWDASLHTSAFAVGIGSLTLILQHNKKLYPACGAEHAVEFRGILENSVVVAVCAAVALVMSYGPTLLVAQFWLVFCAALVLALTLVRPTVRRVFADCDWWAQPVVILGNTHESRILLERYNRTRHEGLRPVGIVFDPTIVCDPDEESGATSEGAAFSDGDRDTPLGEPTSLAEDEPIRLVHAAEGLKGPRSARSRSATGTWLGSVAELESILVGVGASRLVVTGKQDDYHRFQGVPHVSFPTTLKNHPTQQVRLGERDHRIELHSFSGLTSPSALATKRIMDLFLISVSIVAWVPVMLLITAAIKLTDPGPVFFRQRRVGRFGKPFYAIKFRSMVCDAEQKLQRCLERHPEMRREWERTHKLKEDPRVTKIGAFLRKTSLDELPQLLNVLKGEMSLVGPRPIIDGSNYDEEYIKGHPGSL